jgi:hypothetical protein
LKRWGPFLLKTDKWGNGIAVDAAGNAYVVGSTQSKDFPIVNALQPAFGGGSTDAFVTKIHPSGSTLTYSTYLGGRDRDFANGIAVDAAGNTYVGGNTMSDNFPTAAAWQPTFGGPTYGFYGDAFVVKIAP